MRERGVVVINELGLHARAAAKIVRTARSFSSEMTLIRTDTGASADARSILSILRLGVRLGIDICLIADGEDEVDAIKAVERLFLDGFGEI